MDRLREDGSTIVLTTHYLEIQIFRNRLVLVTMLVVPAASSAFYVYLHDRVPRLDLGAVAAVLMFLVVRMGLYAPAVTTLASRRQNLVLKRLRSTAVDDPRIRGWTPMAHPIPGAPSLLPAHAGWTGAELSGLLSSESTTDDLGLRLLPSTAPGDDLAWAFSRRSTYNRSVLGQEERVNRTG
ncbi:hypothetical protein [Nocardiopsis sp. YSL2]|uniref:hypothetical protein n=1 Tax=Nocardiopsis sp. YSL2 TaxID=2939492 RepID=UPI0026F412DF|nr:hypothetical protein [Nocardiopsis sp. YSL2]